MEEYLQFDRYFASLVERQYEHVVGQSTALAYSHAGDLWEEKMNTSEHSAVAEVETQFGLAVHAIAHFSTLVSYLDNESNLARYVPAMTAYQARYGSR